METRQDGFSNRVEYVIMDEANRLIKAFFHSISEGRSMLNSEPALIEARTSLGETPLHYLAVENQLEAVQALVARGAEVNTVSDVGGTPLSEAASLGHARMVKYLLSVGAGTSLEGQTEPALNEAVRSGSLEIARVLIESGADVNARNDVGECALHIAAEKNNIEMVRLLVTAGADLNSKRIFDETPLDIAIRLGASNAEAELKLFGGTGSANK